jgi:hypothetical protein
MDSVLKIKYHIYGILGEWVEADSYEEALASFEEGKIVYEIHETTWSAQWVSGQNVVKYEWH